MPPPAGSHPPSLQTSLCIERACNGDAPSRSLVIERITPLLLAQARSRLARPLRGVEPEDLVQETWAQALPKLRALTPRDGKWTPMLLKFLSVILLRRINDHLRATLRRRGGDEQLPNNEVARMLGIDDSVEQSVRHAVLNHFLDDELAALLAAAAVGALPRQIMEFGDAAAEAHWRPRSMPSR